MAKESIEEYVKRKQELAAQPGTYVVRSNTLESKYLLVRLREYDRLLGWVKNHIGVDIDTEEALALINKCRDVENQFTETLEELRQFVENYKKQKTEQKETALAG
ncbi:MAG: hypothetical protein IBX72_11355 [Nitrospirae bacterium]|nr:hypothetical protein [Nitrospirota bacterium]